MSAVSLGKAACGAHLTQPMCGGNLYLAHRVAAMRGCRSERSTVLVSRQALRLGLGFAGPVARLARILRLSRFALRRHRLLQAEASSVEPLSLHRCSHVWVGRDHRAERRAPAALALGHRMKGRSAGPLTEAVAAAVMHKAPSHLRQCGTAERR